MRRKSENLLLRVDPIMCDGYGHCAELAPELVSLDEWGYPIITDQPFPANKASTVHSARLAVRGCPRQALFIEKVATTP